MGTSLNCIIKIIGFVLSSIGSKILREKEQTTNVLFKKVMKLYFYWSILLDEPLQDRLKHITYDEIHNDPTVDEKLVHL